MPLKVLHHWRLRALHSWPVTTGLRGACQTAIKWQMAVVFVSYSLRMEGEAIKESIVCGRQQWLSGNSQSMSMSRMAMVNDSPNSMRSSAMSDVYSPFHISSVLLIGYLHKWFPSVFCKVILVGTTLVCLFSNLSTCGIFCLAQSKFSFN